MELRALRTVRGGGSEKKVYSVNNKRKEDKQ